MFKFRVPILGILMCLCVLAFSPVASASAYPDRPITMVVPYPPGGTGDTLARILANGMSDNLKSPVIVQNKSGAHTIIGTQYVGSSDADGYTLLFVATPFAINPTLFKELPYDTLNDFSIVSDIAETPLVLAVSAESDVRSVDDLVEKIHTESKIPYGSAGSGSSPHLASTLFLHTIDGDATHVPYRGSAPAVTDLVANRTAFVFDTPLLMEPLIRAGQLTALAQTSTERSALLPDTPTMIESGFPDFQITSWFIVAAPSGVPTDILERLNIAINETLTDPKVNEIYTKQGLRITGGTHEKAQQRVEQEVETWAKAVTLSGASAEQ